MDVEDHIVLELEDKDGEIQKHRDRAEHERKTQRLKKTSRRGATTKRKRKKRADANEQKLAEALQRLQELDPKSSEKWAYK